MPETLVPSTPEDQTTPERFMWDRVINSIGVLGDFDPDIDVYQEIGDLGDEEIDYALDFIYGTMVMIDVEEGTSSELDEVYAFMIEQGLFDI